MQLLYSQFFFLKSICGAESLGWKGFECFVIIIWLNLTWAWSDDFNHMLKSVVDPHVSIIGIFQVCLIFLGFLFFIIINDVGMPEVLEPMGLLPWWCPLNPTQKHTGKSGIVLSTRYGEQTQALCYSTNSQVTGGLLWKNNQLPGRMILSLVLYTLKNRK